MVEHRRRDAVLMTRGTPEWKSWVIRLAEADRASSMPELIDRALIAYAEHVKFPEVPPKR